MKSNPENATNTNNATNNKNKPFRFKNHRSKWTPDPLRLQPDFVIIFYRIPKGALYATFAQLLIAESYRNNYELVH